MQAISQPVKKRSVVLVPSRGRPERFQKCVLSLIEKNTTSDIVAVLDEDDHKDYFRFSNVKYLIGPKPHELGLNNKLNWAANSVRSDYDFILWIADDVIVKTENWDKLLIEAIVDVPNGISYPNDLLQGENLPSNGTCFDASIVRTLGFLAPPTLKHLYIDNFWKYLGEALGTLRYCSNVIVDHQHYVNGKAQIDTIYAAVNANWMYEHDSSEFEKYLKVSAEGDIAKLRKVHDRN